MFSNDWRCACGENSWRSVTSCPAKPCQGNNCYHDSISSCFEGDSDLLFLLSFLFSLFCFVGQIDELSTNLVGKLKDKEKDLGDYRVKYELSVKAEDVPFAADKENTKTAGVLGV